MWAPGSLGTRAWGDIGAGWEHREGGREEERGRERNRKRGRVRERWERRKGGRGR